MKADLLDIKFQRKATKIALGASVAVLAITSLNMKSNFSKKLHIIAGASLVGLSIWHHMLYDDKQAQNLLKNLSNKKAKPSKFNQI